MNKKTTVLAATLVATLALSGNAFAASELRIGMRDDPGSLDPATNATFVGRVSLQSVCDKLVDIDQQGNLVPMLATSWEWSADGKEVTLKLRDGVKFQDGTAFDADAVKFNLDRYLTMEGSRRKPEIAVIKDVAVVDPSTVKLTLSSPSVALLAQFTDRAGMMVSPTAYKATTPDAFAKAPVCAGPYTVAQYRPQQDLTLAKFPGYWNAAAFSFDKVVYSAIPDGNVRLLNLKSGDLDLAENIAPTDAASLAGDTSLKVAVGDQPAYEMLQFNLNGPGANPDVAKYPEVRQAFSLAIDRDAINQVVFGGGYTTGNQAFPPSSQWYDKNFPVQPRDVEAAKAKLASVGLTNVSIDLMISTDPQREAVAEMEQSMLAEAGITLNILPTEFVSMRQKAANGDFQAYVVGSSGHTDPDLNLASDVQCGMANNVGKYCNDAVDKLLAEGRAESDDTKRKAIYDKVNDILMTDMPIVFLYNPKAPYAMKAGVDGFKPYPDGIIRLDGVTLADAK
ncbi:MAG TPA: ABC transporter substrate-binding protein [Devosiaceae bacterium]|jgi:peptide/nickel transport system substrate-binding protein